MALDYHKDLPLKNKSNDQNNKLLKIAILIENNACTKEISLEIIDYSASCGVTPYINDIIHQPTPIIDTTLNLWQEA
jgi:hypothetical protein